MAVEVTVAGDVNVDIVTSPVAEFPARDSQVLIDDVTMSTGGCAANFAKAVATLGAETRLIGNVADDSFGDFVRADLEGVDCRFGHAEKTGATLAIAFDDQTRSFFTYTGGNASFSSADIDVDLLSGRFLHLPSIALTALKGDIAKLMDEAHERGLWVSFDPGPDPRGVSDSMRETVLSACEHTDLLFFNRAEAEAYTGESEEGDMIALIEDLGVDTFVLKKGKEGAAIYHHGARHEIAAFPVEEVADTTGAGDVFDAGFVFGLLQKWDVGRAGRFGAAASAISIQSPGNTGYPRRGDVDAFLSRHT